MSARKVYSIETYKACSPSIQDEPLKAEILYYQSWRRDADIVGLVIQTQLLRNVMNKSEED